MRTAIAAHELLPEGLYLENLSIGAGRVSISAASGTRRSRCPLCGRGSSRVHSRYTRTLSDLPWHGISVELEVRARRFFCEEASCERKIFCERLPDVAARARKTGRLEEALLAIVLELGGTAGARLAAELGILVGRVALLARAKGAPAPELGGKVRVLGVDDFAFRRGARYGTILVDLERRRVVDLLPERSQESLVGWLERHPEVETATRDRSNIYREALTKGAPEATQVADRWHLLHNLALVLEEFLLQKGPALREAAAPEAALEEHGGDDDDAFGSGPIMPNRPRNHDRKIEEAARKRHERLVQQWKDIRRLYLASADLRHICRVLGISARTAFTATRIWKSRLRARRTGGGGGTSSTRTWCTCSSDGTRGAETARGFCGRSASGATKTARRPAPASSPSSGAPRPTGNRRPPCRGRGGVP